VQQSVGTRSSWRSADGGEESTSQAKCAGSIPVIGSTPKSGDAAWHGFARLGDPVSVPHPCWVQIADYLARGLSPNPV
jgi:hypothetical protein